VAAFSKDQLVSALKPCSFIKDLHYSLSIDSTSNLARSLAEEGAPEGTLVISEEQTSGRGRMGRSWVSPPGTGIWISVILRPKILPDRATLITPLVAVALSRSIREATGLPAGIKWPNDIFIRGKKAAGILTEISTCQRSIRHIIVGIGINVNTEYFPEEIRGKATSLSLSSGRQLSRLKILLSLLLELERQYLDFTRKKDFDSFLLDYRRMSVTIGNQVSITVPDGKLTVEAIDITETGGLLIKCKDGTIEEIISGEVQLM
jgi:BirA family transcriptional regulator, biotin operon repressor / biotin---[acetyl-CoA-carboxylase] ligase